MDIEQCRAKSSFTRMPGIGIFRSLAQIINGSKEIISDNRFTDTKCMRYLADDFSIKLGFIRQYAAKHGNTYCHMAFA